MTRNELERRMNETHSTAETKALKDVLALVDFQRGMYGADFESVASYAVYGIWHKVTVKG